MNIRVVSCWLALALLLTVSSCVYAFSSLDTRPAYVNQATSDSSLQSNLDYAADLIVRGSVERVDSQLKGGSIWSRAEVLVHSVEKGIPVSKVLVGYEGGEVGNVGLSVSDQPRFSVGEQVLLYLTRSEGDAFTVVGGPAGKVLLDSSGHALQQQAGSGYSYSGIHWSSSSTPVRYYVNTAGGPTGVLSAVQAGFQAWNDAGAAFSFQYLGTTTWQGGYDDGYNVVSWRYIDGPGKTLARSMTWYNPSSKEIFESDICFDTSESWATDGSWVKYDVQNIAAHESGHWLQLNDLYDSQYSEMTMYGYSSLGETKKRTLEWGDIAGIRFIYEFDFSLSNSGGITVMQGGSGSNTIMVSLVSGRGATQSVSLSCSDLPSNAYSQFNPPSGNPPFMSTFTITAAYPSTPTGSYAMTVIGTGGGKIRTTQFMLTVNPPYMWVTFYTDPASGTITADGVTRTNGAAGTYALGARVHVVANPPTGYVFSYWETSGVSVDSISSQDTYMTVSNDGWLKAHFNIVQAKPWASIVSPSGWLHGTVTLTATAGDSDGYVVRVRFIWTPDKVNGPFWIIGDDTNGVDGWSIGWDCGGPSYNDASVWVAAVALDNSGLESDWSWSNQFGVDHTPPSGSISINAGATYATSTLVTLTLSAYDAGSGIAQMHFSNDGYSWTSWQTYAITASWTLASGDGTKTVYVQFKDNAGMVSSPYSDTIILDTTPPTGSVTIAAGAVYTTTTDVTLTLSASDANGVAQMRFSNDGSSWSDWYSYSTSASWTLASGDGTKTVYVQFKDNPGLVSSYFDTIILDTAPPTGSISINADASYAVSTSVTLTLSYSDATSGVYQVRYSSDGSLYTAWEAPSATKAWTLLSGDGTKTVFYQVKDNAGNIATFTDTIILDTAPPSGSISIDAGATYATSISVTLTLSATDSGSGVSQMCFSNDGSTWSGWESYATSEPWTLSSGDGTKTVYVKYRDNAGLESSLFFDNIILDTTPPTGTVLIDNDATYATLTTVTLTLSAYDAGSGIFQMRFSNDDLAWSSWEPYAASKSWTLTTGDGTKTVYVQFKDNAESVSAAYSDSIVLDTVPPSAPVLLSPSDGETLSRPTFEWNPASDATSGIASYTLQIDNSEQFNSAYLKTIIGITATSYTVTLRDGIWYWRVMAVDNAGNTGSYSAHRTIIVENAQLSFFHPSTEFWFTWYDKVNTQIDNIHFVNPGTATARVRVSISIWDVDSFTLNPGQSTYRNYPGYCTGPVHIVSDQPIWVTQRIVGWNSFKEVPGLPGDMASTEIYYTWYDMAGASWDAIHFLNPSSTAATISVYIAGQLMETTTVGPGGAGYFWFTGVIGGPVCVVSDVPIFSTQRIVGWSDFDEVVGLPSWCVYTEHWFNWYDSVGASWDAIHFINLGASTATINVYIAGSQVESFTLNAGQATWKTYSGVSNGPVRVVSTIPIRVTQRIVGWNGFKELYSVPTELMSTQWYFNWYDTVATQSDKIYLTNPSQTEIATINIYIHGALKGTVTLNPGQATSVTYPSVCDGPVLIQSNKPIMTSQRIIGWSSFEETLGIQWT